jgi:hypothetical protein
MCRQTGIGWDYQVLKEIMKYVFAILLMNGIGVFAQQPKVATNTITAHPAFRIVNGQLYNTDLSTNFATLEGQCIAVLTNGVIVQRIEVQQTYQAVPTNVAQLAGIAKSPVQLVKEERVPGKKFFIRNYPDRPLATIGSPVVARAMRDGVFSYESEIMELWDYGTPNTVSVVTTNWGSTNALKSDLIKR